MLVSVCWLNSSHMVQSLSQLRCYANTSGYGSTTCDHSDPGLCLDQVKQEGYVSSATTDQKIKQ